MTVERITNRQHFEEALREDQVAQDEAARFKAIEDRKKRERKLELFRQEEARNNFGGCA